MNICNWSTLNKLIIIIAILYDNNIETSQLICSANGNIGR